MFNTGPHSSPNREVAALVVMSALILGILAYWAFMKASPKIRPEADLVLAEIEESMRADPSDPHLQQAVKYRERDLAKGGAGAAEAGQAPQKGAAPALEPWREKSPDEIPRDGAAWIRQEEARDEAERAKFKPLMKTFKRLEPDALQIYRLRIEDRVAARDRPKMSDPGAKDDTSRPVTKASKEGLTLELPGGKARKLSWGEVPVGSLYDLARQITGSGGSLAGPTDLIYLAQLADLAGRGSDAAELRTQAAGLHFRRRLVERAAAVRPAFALGGRKYTAVGATSGGVSVREQSGDERTIAWKDLPEEALYDLARSPGVAAGKRDADARALDMLHLSRLAEALSRDEEAQDLAGEALALDPALWDEITRLPAASLHVGILDEFSWVWDPENPTARDARVANDLTDDAPAIFHVFRYMRTLGTERLGKIARRNPPYARLLRRPKKERGRVFRVKGAFISHYRSIRWMQHPEHAEAGLRDLDFCFIRDQNARMARAHYLVSVPHDTRGFKKHDYVGVTGVYLRRWPYKQPSGRWTWIPWIVGLRMDEIELPGSAGWTTFVYVIIGLGVVGALVLFFAARAEWKDTTVARARLTARRHGGRDRIRRKVALALRASGGSGRRNEGGSGDAAPPDDKAPEDEADAGSGGEEKD